MYKRIYPQRVTAGVLEQLAAQPCSLSGNQYEIIEARIRTAIIDARLKPGDALTQESIAAAFGVSRMPVREALRTLERHGYVRGGRYKQYVVAPCSSATWSGDLPGLLRAVSERYVACESAEAQTAFGHRLMDFMD